MTAQTDLDLGPRRAELERQGYRVIEDEPQLLTAVRSRWHWDCVVTKLTLLVRVRRVQRVTVQLMRADRDWLNQHAGDLDPSALPRGFQKGRAVVVIYLADEADDEARALAAQAPTLEFASFQMAAILEASGQESWYSSTRLWGAVYYPKFQHAIRRMLDPVSPAGNEPISVLGAVLMLMMLVPLALMCCGFPLLTALGSL